MIKGPFEVVHYYIGLSIDTKPDAEPGDEFFETDTRTNYICDGSGNWTQKIDGGSVTGAYKAVTNPATSAAVTTAIIDAYAGVLITLTTAGNSQTLANPTILTAGKTFTVINNDTSGANTITVNGVTIAANKAQTFIWDGTVWGMTDIGITTLPVGAPQGGTGKVSNTLNSYLKGNGTSALIERTYDEVRTDLSVLKYDHLLVVDPLSAEVVGRNYQSYANALTYALTQIPAADNVFAIQLSGEVSENITRHNYVNIFGTGNNTYISGNITDYGSSYSDAPYQSTHNIIGTSSCFVNSSSTTSLPYGFYDCKFNYTVNTNVMVFVRCQFYAALVSGSCKFYDCLHLGAAAITWFGTNYLCNTYIVNSTITSCLFGCNVIAYNSYFNTFTPTLTSLNTINLTLYNSTVENMLLGVGTTLVTYDSTIVSMTDEGGTWIKNPVEASTLKAQSVIGETIVSAESISALVNITGVTLKEVTGTNGTYTLAWNSTAKTLTWNSGTPVSISAGNSFYQLTSGASSVWIKVIWTSLPVSNQSDSVAVTKATKELVLYNYLSGDTLIINEAGLLKASKSAYEALVLADNDIPNKKYVDSRVSNNSLLLSQASPQTVTGGRPIFGEGFTFGTTPTVGGFVEGKTYYDATYKTLSVNIGSDVNLQLGQETMIRATNNTVSNMLNGQVVYLSGASGVFPTIALAKSDVLATSYVTGVLTQNIDAGATGFVTVRGVVHDLNTNSFNAGDDIYLSDSSSGAFTNVAPTPPSVNARVGRVVVKDATVGSIYVNPRQINQLSSMSDTSITSPSVDQVLRYNGSAWVNGVPGTSSASNGINFYFNDTNIIPVSTNNVNEVNTFSKTPDAGAEVVDPWSCANNTVLGEAYLYDTALGRTSIDAGVWEFVKYASVSSTTAGRVSTISSSIRRIREASGTVTVTGTGTSRTATASTGTPFASAVIDIGGTVITDSYLRTPLGLYRITARTSDTGVTITTPSTYSNESTVAFSVWKQLFSSVSPTITSVTTNYALYTTFNSQPAYTVLATDKLGIIMYATSNNTTTVNFVHSGSARNSYIVTPLITLHGNLAGLQGGTGSVPSEEYYHLTLEQYTIATQASTDSLPGYMSSADHTSLTGKANKSGETFTGAITAHSVNGVVGGWVQTTGTFTATPASTSTITMTSDLTATILVGYPLKYVIGGTTYYGIVAVIASNLLTVNGAPLGDDVTALYYGDPTRVTQLVVSIPATYEDASSTTLIASDLFSRLKWEKAKSYLVKYTMWSLTRDTGTSGKATVLINAAGVNSSAGGLTINADATEYSTVVDINTSNYDINPGELIEIGATKGGNGDATYLVATLTFVTP